MNAAMRRLPFVFVATLVLAACASADDKPPPVPSKELTSGAATLRGGGFRMDAQLGRGQPRRTTSGGTVVVKPHAVVTP